MASFLPGNSSHQKENLPTSYLVDQKPISYLGSASTTSNSMIYLNQASTGEFSDFLSGNSVNLRSVDGLNIATSNQIRDPMTVDQSFQSQGLSLSLATQIQSPVPVPSFQYQYQGYTSLLNNFLPFSGKGNEFDDSKRGMESRISDGSFHVGSSNAFDAESFSSSQYSMNHGKGIHSSMYQSEPGFSSAIVNSKYLKSVQELLDEVVNVRKALKQSDSKEDHSSTRMPSDLGEPVTNSSLELSPAERQDLQTKKSKLLSMLDEVDRRYKQYYHQMKIVVSSFDMIAGHGAAKAYTALALQTISRHFRSLRYAISGQIQITQRTLGEQETASNSQGETIPRLRFVDHQLRQQRALQQLGVMRNSWRPQRGLPESSVSILRAWLFEHFLNPYPKDSEKIMLAKQTGLTRNQVANWFINARVRLWKPMIEEMYKEEYSELGANSKNAAKEPREQHSSASEDCEDLQESMTSSTFNANTIQPGGIQQFNPTDEENPGGTKFSMDKRPNVDGSNLYAGTFGDAMYDLPELNDFGVSRQVSLALGLRRHENARVASSMAPETPDFHCVDAGNQQDRFGNAHVLHDFVV